MNLSASRKLIIIVGVVVGLLILGIVTVISLTGDSQEATQADQNSGSPESAQGQSEISYTGFAELSQRGLTTVQMEGIKYALFQYAKKASKFAINPATIQQAAYDSDNPTDTIQMTFDMTIDDKEAYKVKVDKYVDLTSVRVYLTSASNNKLVYDSQPVDSRKIEVAPEYIGD